MSAQPGFRGLRQLEHYPRCFGCGIENPHGLGLEVRWDGREAIARYRTPPHAEGAPGIAHGGYVGALVDEIMALAASAGDLPAVSRRVTIEYRAPTPVERPLDIRATVETSRGRKVTTKLEARLADNGAVCFEATGVYVKLPVDLWLERMAPRDPATGTVALSHTTASTYFRYQAHALRQLFDASTLRKSRILALRLRDVSPPDWCLRATSVGLKIAEGSCPDGDALVTSDFQGWQRLLHSPARLEEFRHAGDLLLEGDRDALVAVLQCLPVQV